MTSINEIGPISNIKKLVKRSINAELDMQGSLFINNDETISFLNNIVLTNQVIQDYIKDAINSSLNEEGYEKTRVELTEYDLKEKIKVFVLDSIKNYSSLNSPKQRA